MKNLCVILTVALAVISAQASVTYSPFVMGAGDALGNDIINGSFMLVLDLDGDGWDGIDYLTQAGDDRDNASTWNWDADDMFAIAEIDGDGIGVLDLQIPTPPATYDAEVDHYYVLWFDTEFNNEGPGLGVAYGAVDLGVVGKDPGTYTPDVIAPGIANLVTVPEPASVLFLLSGSLLALRRRKSN